MVHNAAEIILVETVRYDKLPLEPPPLLGPRSPSLSRKWHRTLKLIYVSKLAPKKKINVPPHTCIGLHVSMPKLLSPAACVINLFLIPRYRLQFDSWSRWLSYTGAQQATSMLADGTKPLTCVGDCCSHPLRALLCWTHTVTSYRNGVTKSLLRPRDKLEKTPLRFIFINLLFVTFSHCRACILSYFCCSHPILT